MVARCGDSRLCGSMPFELPTMYPRFRDDCGKSMERFPLIFRIKDVAKRKIQCTIVNKIARPIRQEMLRGKLVDKRVMVGGVSMFYRASIDRVPAQQPPIVMVHGYMVSGRYMEPTGRLLTPYYPVYIPDLPGFGNSGKPQHVLNTTELADALAEWMQKLGLKQAVLIGNSYGCQIITALALRYPELVQSEVLIGPTVNPHAQNLFLLAISWAAALVQEPPSLIGICFQSLLKSSLWEDILTLRNIHDDHIADRLPRIQVPVLVVRGSRDTLVPQNWAEEATALLPQGELYVIKGGIHAVNYDSPVPLDEIIRSFIARMCLPVQI